MLHTLPDEILAKCLAILPHVELLDIQRVCKSWVKLRRSKEFRVKCYKPGAEHTIDGWRLLPMPPFPAWGL